MIGLLAGCTDAFSGVGGDGENDEDGEETATDGGTEATEGGGEGAPGPVEATVELEADAASDWTVSDGIFGRFAENYGDNEIHPGIYAEYVTNTCFVDWEDGLGQPSYLYPPDEVDEHENVPFPWQPVPADGEGVDFERPDGGGVRSDADGNDTYQRVILSGTEGGVGQRLVLPDWRTLGYHCSLSVRGDGVDELEIRLATPDGEPLATASVPVTDEWERHEDVRLELDAESGSEFVAGSVANVETAYGEYTLEFVAGEGRVDLDWISLVPDDALEGKYNPTTADLMDDRNATLLKWPGGNYTSQYHWEDGVGPVEERPVVPNRAWDGLDPNLLGTAEYVEFCELAGAEPTITVGVTVDGSYGSASDYRAPPEPITPEEAAAWVEYCNGDVDTEYGALRAEHGYEEPFDVELWEVGNEVWGPWQMGGTDDPEAFVEVATEFAEAMRAVDDSITITFDAMDPVNEEPNLPDSTEWNDTVLEAGGDHLDGIDVHRYDWGIRSNHGGAAAREDWLRENDAEPIDYSEVLVSFPSQFDEELAGLAADAASAGVDDFQIVVGEWGLFPEVSEGWPYPGMDTMAGAAYVAGMFNAFIRRGEHVRRASHTHMPIRMFPPVAADFPPDPNPLLPTGRTHALYADPFDSDATWRVVPTTVDGDARDLPRMGYLIRPMDDVTYLDAVAIRSDGGELVAFATNRNLRAPCEVRLEVPDDLATEATVTRQEPTGDPHDSQTTVGDAPGSWFEWTDLEGYELTEETRDAADGVLEFELRPAGVARVRIDPR